MKVWTKDPDENADFSIDWSTELGDDTIASSEWLDITPGITTDTKPDTYEGQFTTIWIEDGSEGQVYLLTNRVTTVGGRTFDQQAMLRVTSNLVAPTDFNGCLWPVDPACLTEVWNTYSPDVQSRALALASASLYRLVAYRVGGCPVTVRPALSQTSGCAPFDQFAGPRNWGGVWTNDYCGPLGDPRLVALPAPIGRIDEVKVDGNVVDPANYTVIEDHYLAWTGIGDVPWPVDQDWLLPDTEPGTFSVTYLNAYPVDGQGAYAAGILALEFALACSNAGSKKCRLPSNVTNVVRAGVAYEMTASAFPEGRTGIREIDTYIEAWNPRGHAPSVIIVPGQSKVHVQR